MVRASLAVVRLLTYGRGIAVTALRLILALAVLASCGPEGPPPRPNVVLISVDSLRADHVGLYGYERPTTPRLDALAAEGAAFLAAYAPAPWTLPSHVTLLTALPPEAHGVVRRNRSLTARATTLAEVLQAAGWATAGFVSGPLLRRLHGHDQGFDVYDDESVRTTRVRPGRGTTSPQVVRLADEWITRTLAADPARPFFVFLHFWDVHYDYDPPAPYDSMFDPDYAGDLDASDFENNPAIRPGMDPRDLEHLIALYDGEIRFTDAWIGRLLDRLDDLGIRQDTIVIVTSDHGDEFLEHGRLGHAKTLFEEMLRVPLVVRYPRRVPRGRRFGGQVRLQDVGPTVLGLAGVPAPQGFGVAGGPPGARGVDLGPWLVGTAPGAPPELPAYASSAVLGPKRSVQVPGRKLIMNAAPRMRPAFYDLEVDPAERGSGRPSRARRADERRLRRMLERWSAFFGERRFGYSERRTLDPAHVEQLRALGYLE